MPVKVESWRTTDGRFFATEAEAKYREAELAEVNAYNALCAAKTDILRSLAEHTPTSSRVTSDFESRSCLPIRQAAVQYADAFGAYCTAFRALSAVTSAFNGRYSPDGAVQRMRSTWPVRDVPEEYR